jgi:hypothetical protein
MRQQKLDVFAKYYSNNPRVTKPSSVACGLNFDSSTINKRLDKILAWFKNPKRFGKRLANTIE